MLSIPSKNGTHAIYIHFPRSIPSQLVNSVGLIARLVGMFMLAVYLVLEDYVRASKDTFTEAQAVIGIVISTVGMYKFVLFPI